MTLLRSSSTPAGRPRPWLTVATLVVAGLLGGCATNVGDQIPTGLGGLPAEAPARPVVQPDYPAVHDMPPPRPVRMLDEGQQEKLQKDLSKVRDRQEGRNPKPPTKPKKPADAGVTLKP